MKVENLNKNRSLVYRKKSKTVEKTPPCLSDYSGRCSLDFRFKMLSHFFTQVVHTSYVLRNCIRSNWFIRASLVLHSVSENSSNFPSRHRTYALACSVAFGNFTLPKNQLPKNPLLGFSFRSQASACRCFAPVGFPCSLTGLSSVRKSASWILLSAIFGLFGSVQSCLSLRIVDTILRFSRLYLSRACSFHSHRPTKNPQNPLLGFSFRSQASACRCFAPVGFSCSLTGLSSVRKSAVLDFAFGYIRIILGGTVLSFTSDC